MLTISPEQKPEQHQNSRKTGPAEWIRRLYDWVLGWGRSRYGRTALFCFAFAESSFFPIPPDVLLVALCMGRHKSWKSFALICSAGSILGGAFGYFIGYAAFDIIGQPILSFVASLSGNSPEHLLNTAEFWFNDKEIWGMKVGAWAVGMAGVTPIPYKVFTISAGFFKMNFAVFVVASIISRSLRFFVVAGIIGLLYERFGDQLQQFIDRYFNLLAIAFVVMILLGFMVLNLF